MFLAGMGSNFTPLNYKGPDCAERGSDCLPILDLLVVVGDNLDHGRSETYFDQLYGVAAL